MRHTLSRFVFWHVGYTQNWPAKHTGLGDRVVAQRGFGILTLAMMLAQGCAVLRSKPTLE